MKTVTREQRGASLMARVGSLVRAIETDDEAKVEAAILRLSHSRRVFAPLGLAVGALALLYGGLRLIVTHWRLALVQLLPAMWVWVPMYDLKLHVRHGKSLPGVHGAVLIPLGLVIMAITAGAFFLNAVFAFAISRPGAPRIRFGFAQARGRLPTILAWGSVVGVMLAIATLVAPHWNRPWFTVSLGVVIGIMMVCYVTVPARLIGVKKPRSTRDKLWTSAISGAVGATVSTPPYVLARVGILMLGSKALFIPGLVVLTLGVTLHAGATSAVRAIKMSATLAPGHAR
jgi:hypothetical protein